MGTSKDVWTDKHLFDMENDPTEVHDLKDDPDYNDIKAELRKLLISKAEYAGEGTFTISETNDKVSNDL